MDPAPDRVSLCYLGAGTAPGRPRLDRQAAADTGLAALREQFGLPEELLFELCQDVATIHYRQSVLADVLGSAALREVLREARPR